MTGIKCVAFDWGGVLIDNPVDDFAKECSQRIGISIQELKESYSSFAEKFEKGLLPEHDLWLNIGKQLNINIPDSNSLWYECFKTVYSPRKPVFNLAKKLKNSGILVALLSNTEVPAMNFFNSQNYDFFDVKVFSCAEGCRKPESEIYQILLNRLNLPATQILFIDDREENVLQAKNMGMKSILYDNFNQVLEELKKENIISLQYLLSFR